jgi:hypothetical protein
MLQLELTRRRPAPVTEPADRESEILLAGLIVETQEVHDDPGAVDEAVLILRLRRWHNTHGCTRLHPEDPPCQKPGHWKDVALLRGSLMKLGLPGSTDVLALGYAHEKDYR